MARALTEGELLALARDGDADAYASLVRAHQDVAFRTAMLITQNAADAEDAAQEAFVKAWRALARRGPVERPAVLEVGDLRLDPAASRVWRGDTEVSLSAKEFQLLETFMRHPGEVLSRYQLLEHAWDYDYENRSNIVDVYVRYLRDKIDRPFGLSTLETVRGAGYRLDDRVPAAVS